LQKPIVACNGGIEKKRIAGEQHGRGLLRNVNVHLGGGRIYVVIPARWRKRCVGEGSVVEEEEGKRRKTLLESFPYYWGVQGGESSFFL